MRSPVWNASLARCARRLARWIQEKAAKLPAMEQLCWLLSKTTCWNWTELWSFVRDKAQPTLGLDCPLSSHPTGRRQLHRRPQRRQSIWLCASSSPKATASCCSCSDFWEAYQLAFDAATHRAVGKETGETAHVERWNNTLRSNAWPALCARHLAFSKSDHFHNAALKFVHP